MIDIAAQAAREAYFVGTGTPANHTWDEILEVQRELWRAIARAAIEAETTAGGHVLARHDTLRSPEPLTHRHCAIDGEGRLL